MFKTTSEMAKSSLARRRWVGIILANGQGQFLLNLRDDRPDVGYANHWNLIGGVVEPDESPDEAILRELAEETGEVLSSVKPFKVYEVHTSQGPADYHIYYALLDKNATDLTLGEGQEHRFFALADIRTLRIVPWEVGIISEFAASHRLGADRG